MSDPSYAARIWEFTSAVVSYWYVWVTTVLFMIDQGLSHQFLPKKLVDFVDKKWPPNERHRVLKWLCVIGFVVASFQAFDDVNGRLREAQRQHQGQTNPREWGTLSAEESSIVRTKLRDLDKKSIVIFCVDAFCLDMADSFDAVFSDLGWKHRVVTQFFDMDDAGVGIRMIPVNQITRTIADAIEQATKGRLKFGFTPNINEGDVNIVIGHKKK